MNKPDPLSRSVRVTISFDGESPYRVFGGSRSDDPIVKRNFTEAGLLEEALAVRSDLTAEELVHHAALVFMRNVVLRAKGKSFRERTFRTGAADSRLLAVLKATLAENRQRAKDGKRSLAITSGMLALKAKTNKSTALSWMLRNSALFEGMEIR